MQKKTKKACILAALDMLGDRTSLAVLNEKANRLYGGEIDECYCSQMRSFWRYENKSNVDCRTYEGQPMRNMVASNADTIDAEMLFRTVKYFSIPKPTIKDFMYLLNGKGKNKFETVDQLMYAVEDLKKLATVQFAA